MVGFAGWNVCVGPFAKAGGVGYTDQMYGMYMDALQHQGGVHICKLAYGNWTWEN